MPERVPDPRDFPSWANDKERRLTALERRTLKAPTGIDTILQTFEDGSPLGDTRFLDFGAGLQATLIGDDFVRVTGAGAAEGPFDAIVDGSLAASDPENRLFIGIGEALEYLYTVVGLVDACAVAVRPYPGLETAGYLETAHWNMPANTRLFGLRGVGPRKVGASMLPAWTWMGYKPISSSSSLEMHNFGQFQPDNFTFRVAGRALDVLVLYDTYVDTHSNVDQTAPTAALCQHFFGVHTTWDIGIPNNNTFTLASGSAIFIDGSVSVRRFLSGSTYTCILASAGPLIMTAGSSLVRTSGITAPIITLPSRFDLDICDNNPRNVANGSIPPLPIPSGARGRIRARSESFTGAPTVTATSSFLHLELEGSFGDLTITGTHDNLHVRGVNFGGIWDIKGPAVIYADTTERGRYIFRGDGISGTVSGDVLHSAISGAWLDFIAARYCAIVAGVDGAGTTAPAKPYAFDASSVSNTLVLAGGGTFPAAGTDAGTGNRVLPEGTSPITINGHVVEDEGTPLTQRANLNFAGGGVTATDASPDTLVTIPGPNIAEAFLNAKGDVISATADNTPSIVTVGADPKILTADSSAASGLSYLDTRRDLGLWVQDNVAASQTAVVLNLYGDTTRSAVPMVRAGSITGIVVRSNEARTAGTLTVEVTKNGTGVGLTAVLDGTNTTFKSTTQAQAVDTFVAGDEIGVIVTTDAGWLPTTADISVLVEVAT